MATRCVGPLMASVRVRSLFSAGFLAFFALATAPAQASLQELVDQSVYILQDFRANGPRIPKAVFDKAKGVVVMKVTKGGLIFAGKSGSGTLNTRTRNGWSGPVAVTTSGASFGLQAGGEVSEMVLLLTSDRAVNRFINDSSIRFEGEMRAVAGPTQEELSEQFSPTADVYVYNRTGGAFAGISIKGGVFTVSTELTNRYYGKPVSVSDVLNGRVAVPNGALKLVDTLATYGGKSR